MILRRLAARDHSTPAHVAREAIVAAPSGIAQGE
jgi:hypothetical protein